MSKLPVPLAFSRAHPTPFVSTENPRTRQGLPWNLPWWGSPTACWINWGSLKNPWKKWRRMRWEIMKRLMFINCFMDFKKWCNKMDEETLDLSGKSCLLFLSLDILLKELKVKEWTQQRFSLPPLANPNLPSTWSCDFLLLFSQLKTKPLCYNPFPSFTVWWVSCFQFDPTITILWGIIKTSKWFEENKPWRFP